MGEGITGIGNYAFYDIGNSSKPINSIYLPSTLKSIGDYAFAHTYFGQAVEKFVLPDSVTSLGKGAFYYCTFYNYSKGFQDGRIGATFVLGKGIKVIPEECFMHASIVKMVFPEGLERIEARGLCSFLLCKEFVFPKSLKYIGGRGLGL